MNTVNDVKVFTIPLGIFDSFQAVFHVDRLPIMKLTFSIFQQEYLLADRSMPILPVAFSLMASFISSITLLGVSSEIYSYGTQFVIINISYGVFCGHLRLAI
jgi:Na+/pantothenate symporter